MKVSTLFLMLFTLVAFAANSILCRQALMTGSIGPVEFTAIRLGSGIIALLPVIVFHKSIIRSLSAESVDRSDLLKIKTSNMWQAMALFGYAIFFSLAYVQLDAGTGALILFASVQITMIGISIIGGNRVTPLEWMGLVMSFSGLVYLLSPGLSAPPALGTIMMIASGVSWGIYSLLGQRQSSPILSTARNFLFCLPGVIILGLFAMGSSVGKGGLSISSDGIILAAISGSVASGMGYVLWYLTVSRITTTVASVSQLVVPIIAAIGGILFLNESISLRLVIASILIVGGIVITIVKKRSPHPRPARYPVK